MGVGMAYCMWGGLAIMVGCIVCGFGFAGDLDLPAGREGRSELVVCHGLTVYGCD